MKLHAATTELHAATTELHAATTELNAATTELHKATTVLHAATTERSDAEESQRQEEGLDWVTHNAAVEAVAATGEKEGQAMDGTTAVSTGRGGRGHWGYQCLWSLSLLPTYEYKLQDLLWLIRTFTDRCEILFFLFNVLYIL